jgi:hypothetical protein
LPLDQTEPWPIVVVAGLPTGASFSPSMARLGHSSQSY